MVEIHTLSNGLRVAAEKMPFVHSVTIGVWVRAGSMLETAEDNGLSHLMEHMSFKGTENRSTRQLAEDMDAIGGQVNAATSRTATTYYARVIEDEMEKALELLADILCHPALDEEELDRERNVVLEEIAMADDSPEEVIFDLANNAIYGDGTLSRSILGEKKNIRGFGRKDLLDFRRKYYAPRNTVLAVAGSFDMRRLLSAAERLLGAWQGGEEAVYPLNVANEKPRVLAVNRRIEQTHLCIGFTGLKEAHPDSYAMAVMANILGGGMSSRLFQKIREEKGLVYSVFSAPSSYPGTGDLMIYAAATPKNVQAVLDGIRAECLLMAKEGVTGKELEQTKVQLKTGVVLSEESSYHLMNRVGGNMLMLGREVPVTEVLDNINAVTEEDVARLAAQTLLSAPSLALIGPKADKVEA